MDAVTVSRAQHEFAHARIVGAGLEGRVNVRLIDYRDVAGRYDRIVSIEMLEAVGEAYWPLYFRRLDELLSPDGCVVMQAIVIAESHYDAYRRQPDFIQRHIFPGGMLPTVSIIEAMAATRGFTVDHLSFHGADYAETLRHWRARFEAEAGALDRLGHGERFRRLWRYYLAYCEAGFETERIDVVQVRLRRCGSGSRQGSMYASHRALDGATASCALARARARDAAARRKPSERSERSAFEGVSMIGRDHRALVT